MYKLIVLEELYLYWATPTEKLPEDYTRRMVKLYQQARKIDEIEHCHLI